MRSLCLNDSASFLALGIFLGIDIGVLSRRALPQSPSSMVQSGDWFILPDLYAALPFNGCQNPLFHIVGKESRDLINSYGVLPPHCRAGFTPGELFAFYCYPHASNNAFRVFAVFIDVLLVLDEVSDVQALRNDPDGEDRSLVIACQDGH